MSVTRSVRPLLFMVCIIFGSAGAVAQSVGDRVWIPLSADKPSDDGFAEALVVGIRPPLVEVQASRVTMRGRNDLADRLRRGTTFVPAADVVPFEVGSTAWDRRRTAVDFAAAAEDRAFQPASPALKDAVAGAADPLNRDRIAEVRILLALLDALVDPSGPGRPLEGPALDHAEEGWISWSQPTVAGVEAFDERVLDVLARAAGAVRAAGGPAAIVPDDRLGPILRVEVAGGGARLAPGLSPAARRVAHLIGRAIRSPVDVARVSTPDRIVRSVATLPALATALEALHPDALHIERFEDPAQSPRDAFVQAMRDRIMGAFKDRLVETEQMRTLRQRYFDGEDAALDAWMTMGAEGARAIEAAVGGPLFDDHDRSLLTEQRRALQAQRERDRAAAEAEAEARIRREASIAQVGTAFRDRWLGSAVCAGNAVPVLVQIGDRGADGRVTAELDFVVPGDVARVAMEGAIDPDARRLRLVPTAWLMRPPAGRDASVSPMTLALSGDGGSAEAAFGEPQCTTTRLNRPERTAAGATPSSAVRWVGLVVCGGRPVPVEVTVVQSGTGFGGAFAYGDGGDRASVRLAGRQDPAGTAVRMTPGDWIARPAGAAGDPPPPFVLTPSGDGRTAAGAFERDVGCAPFRFLRAN